MKITLWIDWEIEQRVLLALIVCGFLGLAGSGLARLFYPIIAQWLTNL